MSNLITITITRKNILAFCQSDLLPIGTTNEIIMTYKKEKNDVKKKKRYIWHIIEKCICPGNEPDQSK